jgi:hypothetical protein
LFYIKRKERKAVIKLENVVGKRVCKNCKWIRYYGAGIWLCVREGSRLEEGVLEVNPLQSGCEWWEGKEKVRNGV